jgi:hypothetical protein
MMQECQPKSATFGHNAGICDVLLFSTVNLYDKILKAPYGIAGRGIKVELILLKTVKMIISVGVFRVIIGCFRKLPLYTPHELINIWVCLMHRHLSNRVLK